MQRGVNEGALANEAESICCADRIKGWIRDQPDPIKRSSKEAGPLACQAVFPRHRAESIRDVRAAYGLPGPATQGRHRARNKIMCPWIGQAG